MVNVYPFYIIDCFWRFQLVGAGPASCAGLESRQLAVEGTKRRAEKEPIYFPSLQGGETKMYRRHAWGKSNTTLISLFRRIIHCALMLRKGNKYIMKSYRKELYFNLPARRGFINITPQVEEAVRASGVTEGLVLVNAMNITASVFINDDESGLHWDMEQWLERLAPEKPYEQYRHNGYEDNADAHLKRTVMGREVVCAITNGKLDFGTWEQIFYGEFDGKRQKRVLIKIIGE